MFFGHPAAADHAGHHWMVVEGTDSAARLPGFKSCLCPSWLVALGQSLGLWASGSSSGWGSWRGGASQVVVRFRWAEVCAAPRLDWGASSHSLTPLLKKGKKK